MSAAEGKAAAREKKCLGVWVWNFSEEQVKLAIGCAFGFLMSLRRHKWKEVKNCFEILRKRTASSSNS